MSNSTIVTTYENKPESSAFQKICSSVNFKKTLFAILPLMLAQIVQRFYPIIDNHYISNLGAEALLIHNIQYGFINFGQYIGSATAVSCLVFWNRAEYHGKQGGIFYINMGMCIGASLLFALIASVFSNQILSHFSVPTEYYSLASRYFHLGLCNMVLQALYIGLIGIVISVNKERLSLFFSLALLGFNIVSDSLVIHFLFSGAITPQNVSPAMLTIIVANMSMVAVCIGIMLYLLKNQIKHCTLSKTKEVLKIWFNEIGGAFISGFYPIIYLFQLGQIATNGSLLVTYQLLMQLTAVFCIPILATMQVALRDAAAEQGRPWSGYAPHWVRVLNYFGLIPTQILLIIFMIFPIMLINMVFGYSTPVEHLSYIIIYLFASIIGQLGNAFTVAIRARKNSHLVTTGYFISDVIILVGGTQLLFLFHIASPMTAGIVMLIYTCCYTAINAYFALRKRFQ
jgi:Na+-driven multidrug efflux pump